MKSSYPSSQSFFDCTSDSIRVDELEKLRSTPSFSTLADLFTNRSRKSDLFPNVRASVSAPEEICFPAKKKRECEEKTSIWHEWGSGECQGEHVAQESYGFSSEHLVGKSSVPSRSYFPNLGSANINVVAEGFTFPARKEREEGSSWREERTWGKDWSTTIAPKESKATESSPIVGSITDMYLSKPCTKPFDAFASSKSSPFASLGNPSKSACEEVSFPARKKREERSFWQESALDCSKSDCKVKSRPRESISGSGSLADMYVRKAGSKCSNLFSNGEVGSTEEVVFPKRRNRADRNIWRDWSNTGYGDYEDETDLDYWIDNSYRSTSSVAPDINDLDSPCVAAPSIEGLNRVSANLPASECVLRRSGHGIDSDVADLMQVPRQANQGQGCEPLSGLTHSAVDNVVESGYSEPFQESQADRCSESTSSKDDRTMDGTESCDSIEDIRSVAGDVQESTFTGSNSEQKSARNAFKYPPPLRSLSRQGSSRVPSHMPWVQLERIRSDGRFVLQEGKTTQPVVFQPIRKEGRLVLELIGQDTKKGDAGPPSDKDSLIADEKPTPVSGEMDLNDPVTMKTYVEVVQEKTEARQTLDDAAVVKSERKKNSKVGPAFGALEEKREKKSAAVWPIYYTPRELLPGEELFFARAEEAAAGIWDKKFNFREVQFPLYVAEEIIQSPDRRVPERDTPATGEGAPIQDRPPPWLLGKVATEDRRFDSKRVLQSVSRIPRLGQAGNIITIHGARDTTPIRVHFQPLPRTSSLRNGLSGLSSRVEGEGSMTRSRSIRSSALSDVATSTSRKEEARGRPADARISLCQGIIRDSVMSLAATQFFGKSVRTRPDIPGEPYSRFSNYKQIVPVSLAFSCADGMGKRHHEKNFWEQQACVSIST